MEEERLSHVDEAGKARMVDVSGKRPLRRRARAAGRIELAPGTLALVRENGIAKGEVLAVARLAGIMGAKRTSELIPLCHNVEIEHVGVELRLAADGIEIEATAACTDKTGIEMEALTAVAVAALAVYDMCKAVDKTMRIGEIRLLEKTKEELP